MTGSRGRQGEMPDDAWEIPSAFVEWQRMRRGVDADADLMLMMRRAATAALRFRVVWDAGDAAFGDSAVVWPVHRNGERFALKVAVDTASAEMEAESLRRWAGCGMVALHSVDADTGSLLLERLGPQSLADVALVEALPIAGRLLRRLCLIPIGNEIEIETTALIAREFGATAVERNEELDFPMSAQQIATVVRLTDSLRQAASDVIVHADLHWGNVLGGERERWLAIDPRPRRGDPEIAIAELLWARVDEMPDAAAIRSAFGTLTVAAELDPMRARAWAVVRAADYLLWGREHGLTEDPPRCLRIIAALFET